MDVHSYANSSDLRRKDAKYKDRNPESARNMRNVDNDIYQHN
jgi:hypothetical protein